MPSLYRNVYCVGCAREWVCGLFVCLVRMCVCVCVCTDYDRVCGFSVYGCESSWFYHSDFFYPTFLAFVTE